MVLQVRGQERLEQVLPQKNWRAGRLPEERAARKGCERGMVPRQKSVLVGIRWLC